MKLWIDVKGRAMSSLAVGRLHRALCIAYLMHISMHILYNKERKSVTLEYIYNKLLTTYRGGGGTLLVRSTNLALHLARALSLWKERWGQLGE